MYIYNIIVCGESGVGKTTFIKSIYECLGIEYVSDGAQKHLVFHLLEDEIFVNLLERNTSDIEEEIHGYINITDVSRLNHADFGGKQNVVYLINKIDVLSESEIENLLEEDAMLSSSINNYGTVEAVVSLIQYLLDLNIFCKSTIYACTSECA